MVTMSSNADRARAQHDIVVAFDIGTTFSGYAFSTKAQFQANNLDIVMNSSWSKSTEQLFSKKTPTSLLLSPSKEFVAFGSEAEKMYDDLVQEEKHSAYYFFWRFKMILHSRKKIKRTLKLKAENGESILAQTVFALTIHGIRMRFLDQVKQQNGSMPAEDDILYIITVPAIWTDSAKLLMREAAVEAGIKNEHVVLGLEPEVASLYCQLLPVDLLHTSKDAKFTVSKPGCVFMVVDLGGGTTDVTVHQRQNDGKLKEVYFATGGAHGGTGVDRNFFIFLAKLLGIDVIKKFRETAPDDYMTLYKKFEATKRSITTETASYVLFELPFSLCDIYQTFHQKKLGQAFPEEFADKVDFSHYKLKIKVEVIQEFFHPIANEIIIHLKNILSNPKCCAVRNVLLVGGFSESSFIYKSIENAFPRCRVIVPFESETVVLKGAVIYGHDPEIITSRVLRFTYGVSYMTEFQEGVHPEEKKIFKKGQEKPLCKDLFEKFVEIGQSVEKNTTISKQYSPARAEQTSLSIVVYASKHKNPLFVTDEGCWKLGKLLVYLPENAHNSELEIEERMIFGESELRMEAIEPISGHKFATSFDIL